jgi:hypothetical protein
MVGPSRIKREKRTMQAMMVLYCRHHHSSNGLLCDDCTELLDYANHRIDLCPYQEKKPTCKICPIHCYKSDPREEIRKVMRYSGPRLILYHPILTLMHLLDGKQKPPSLKKGGE